MLDFSQEGIDELTSRFRFCYIAIASLLLFILFRLAFLQLIKGDFFWILSSEHAVKEVRIPATRGILFDRYQVPLAKNRPSFDLTVIPQYLHDREAVKRSLAEIAGISPQLFETSWKEVQKLPPFYPLTIRSDIPYDLAARLRVVKVSAAGAPDRYDLRGVEVIGRPLRDYPFGLTAASLLGYLGEVSEKELTRLQREAPRRYFLGDLVGATGLEKYWETVLEGQDGYQQKVVDAAGREVSSKEVALLLTHEPPVPGSDLILTVDHRLQRFAEEQFRSQSGGLVALDPKTGEVLALVSLPTYDPARLMVNVAPDYWQSLLSDPRKPFLNRPLQSYPPGSTFKIVTAIAALEEKLIRPETKIHCSGGLNFGKRFFRCWRSGGHGDVDLHRALAESCDTYFYQLGMRLGVDRIAKYARLFGLGSTTGIDLPEEKAGLIPTSEWKRKTFGEEWYAGEDLSVAVGQGSVLVTPLQGAVLMAELINGGHRISPHLLQGPEKEHPFEDEIPVAEETLKLVRSALADVVRDPAGTAHGIYSEKISIGGKTGTAQVISEEGRRRAVGSVNLRDHAWFVAFAPVEEPRIAVSVLVEHGGFGASAAAPIAKAVIEKFMELSKGEP